MKTLLLVCDDAGHASVDRGIRALADATGMPVCAEYLILTPGAVERAKEMSAHPLVSIGLHVELAGITDADRVTMAKDLRLAGSTLGEQPDVRAKAARDAREQLSVFRAALGHDPVHVSTHGDFNVDASGVVMPWWNDLMHEIFGKTVPPMQWKHPVVRHNMYSWNVAGNKRTPRTAHEFKAELQRQSSDVVEFVMHPAAPKPGDAPIDMLFTADMRVGDLAAAIHVITSGCIESAGYRVVPVSEIR